MKNRTIAIISVTITLVIAVIIGIFILNRPAETTTLQDAGELDASLYEQAGELMLKPTNEIAEEVSETIDGMTAEEIEETSEQDPTPEVPADTTPTDVEPPVEEDTENLFQGYTQDELYAAYEEAYQKAEELDELDFFAEGYRIQGEIEIAALALYTDKDWATPKHHADDYMLWRNEFHPVVTEPSQEEIENLNPEKENTEVPVEENPDYTYDEYDDAYYQQDNPTAAVNPENSYDLDDPSPDSDIPIAPTAGGDISVGADTDESNISSGNHGEDDTSGITLHG